MKKSPLLAGAAATVPMTVFLSAMRRMLPPREQYPLPPREIVAELAEESGLRRVLTPAQEHFVAVLSHYGYGALAGAFYGALTVPGASTPVRGAAFGLALWTVSYLGWLPALGILRPATQHPRRRTAMMIASHLLWGAVLAALLSHTGNDPGARKKEKETENGNTNGNTMSAS